MTVFFKTLIPIHQYEKTKIDIYKEMETATHEKDTSFFSHCITPYRNLEELGQQIRAIPVKFHICLLQSAMELISGFITLARFGFKLLTCDSNNASQFLLETINRFGSATYYLASAIIDPLLTFLSFISRDVVSIADGIYRCIKSVNNEQKTEDIPTPGM
ncbi:hypothetical protein [Legionella fairfieldensis]|uniref:hypothetical protein n=1 Tax=Legionella fairfieldensis TaxID=45064 RepID=UPI00048B5749|nr:hypothetical protein [Legionella fairfieldensis]